jgi:chaperonin GroEL
VITVEEARGLETETEIVEGMQFDRSYLCSKMYSSRDSKLSKRISNSERQLGEFAVLQRQEREPASSSRIQFLGGQQFP